MVVGSHIGIFLRKKSKGGKVKEFGDSEVQILELSKEERQREREGGGEGGSGFFCFGFKRVKVLDKSYFYVLYRPPTVHLDSFVFR